MGYRVMVVDDSPVLRLMLSEMLQDLGHEVVGEGDSAEQGFTLYKEMKPDLVTLDLSLPDGNGFDLLARLRRIDPGVKALIVTGNNQKTVAERAREMKVLGVLHKPFDRVELKELIERLEGALRR